MPTRNYATANPEQQNGQQKKALGQNRLKMLEKFHQENLEKQGNLTTDAKARPIKKPNLQKTLGAFFGEEKVNKAFGKKNGED